MSRIKDEQIERMLREVTDVDVPEPSPLFWDHFAARVNAAIDAPPVRRRWWHPSAALGWTAAALFLVIAFLGFYLMPSAERSPEPLAAAHPPVSDGITASVDRSDADVGDIETDEAWAVVRSLADELQYEDAREAGVVPRAGSVERAVTELPPDERAELLRILENELKRTGA